MDLINIEEGNSYRPRRLPYPKEVYNKRVNELKEGQVILSFSGKNAKFVLERGANSFVLKKNTGGDFVKKEFPTLEKFWGWFQSEGGQLAFTPEKVDVVMEIFIVTFNNLIREEGNFTYQDYKSYNLWENAIKKEGLTNEHFWQFCPGCGKQIDFNSLYPKSLCPDCEEKVTDESGREVRFFNTDTFGYGCKGVYKDTGEFYPENTCFLEGRKYIAEEARFGGIKINLIEEE